MSLRTSALLRYGVLGGDPAEAACTRALLFRLDGKFRYMNPCTALENSKTVSLPLSPGMTDPTAGDSATPVPSNRRCPTRQGRDPSYAALVATNRTTSWKVQEGEDVWQSEQKTTEDAEAEKAKGKSALTTTYDRARKVQQRVSLDGLDQSSLYLNHRDLPASPTLLESSCPSSRDSSAERRKQSLSTGARSESGESMHQDVASDSPEETHGGEQPKVHGSRPSSLLWESQRLSREIPGAGQDSTSASTGGTFLERAGSSLPNNRVSWRGSEEKEGEPSVQESGSKRKRTGQDVFDRIRHSNEVNTNWEKETELEEETEPSSDLATHTTGRECNRSDREASSSRRSLDQALEQRNRHPSSKDKGPWILTDGPLKRNEAWLQKRRSRIENLVARASLVGGAKGSRHNTDTVSHAWSGQFGA